MKINSALFRTNFKGYDALPLKGIYLEKNFCSPFFNEMSEIASKEGFEIKTICDNDQWTQDRKTIIEKDSKPYFIAYAFVSDGLLEDLANRGIDCKKTYNFIIGGDTFIGKYPNGEKWILTGDKVGINVSKKDVAKTYGVDKKNIFTIPKQNYHLDTFIRPVCYPYVLVNDYNLVNENLAEIDDNSVEFNQFLSKSNRFNNNLLEEYCGPNIICSALSGLGFIPIRIAGVYGEEINFLNAIVNKHNDGTISYITNSSDTGNNNFYKKIQNTFEKDLRKKLPNISEIYFVQGKDSKHSSKINYMMSTLKHQGGGIHCMSLEEPNFEVWA